MASLNLNRRHMDNEQRAMAAAKLANPQQGQRQDRSIDLSTTLADAAKTFCVSETTVKRARSIQDSGCRDLLLAVDSSTVAVSSAYDIASLPKDEQRALVEAGPRL